MFYPQDEMEIDMKTFTLVRYRGRRHDIRIVRIPWGVEKIGPNAFCYSERVKGLLLPDTVTQIGESAFRCCRYLEMAEIPGSVRTTKLLERTYWLCIVSYLYAMAGFCKSPESQ